MAFKLVLGLVTIVWGIAFLLTLPSRIFFMVFWLVSQEPQPGKAVSLILALLPTGIFAASIILSWTIYRSKNRNWKTFSLAAIFPLVFLILSSTYYGFFDTEGFGFLSPSKYFKQVATLNGNYEASDSKKIATVLVDGRIALFGGTNIKSAASTSPIEGGRWNGRKAVMFDPSIKKVSDIPDSPYQLTDQLSLQVIGLPSGNILITGNEIGGPNRSNLDIGKRAAAEQYQTRQATTSLLYQPKFERYQSLFNFRPVRSWETNTLLPNGKILVIGGVLSSKEISLKKKEGQYLPTSKHQKLTPKEMKVFEDWRNAIRGAQMWVQIFDPEADSITKIADLPYGDPIYGHTTTSIDRNRYLLVGGIRDAKDTYTVSYIKEIYMFDVEEKTFLNVGRLNFPRAYHSTVQLDGNHFLIVGGTNMGRSQVTKLQHVTELEVFDLETGDCKVVGVLPGDSLATPARLPDGRILLISEDKIGLFDPENNSVRIIDQFGFPRKRFSVVSTPNGNVYRLGGIGKGDIAEFDYSAFQKSK